MSTTDELLRNNDSYAVARAGYGKSRTAGRLLFDVSIQVGRLLAPYAAALLTRNRKHFQSIPALALADL